MSEDPAFAPPPYPGGPESGQQAPPADYKGWFDVIFPIQPTHHKGAPIQALNNKEVGYPHNTATKLAPPQQGYQAGPPQQGYPPGAGQVTYTAGQTVVVQPTSVVVQQQIFRDFPVECECPNCHNRVTTVVNHSAGTFAWLLCLIMFLFACWLCCWIPFCVSDMQDKTHSCPVCKTKLGTFKHIYQSVSESHHMFSYNWVKAINHQLWICCLIPFCMDSCKDTTHSCPVCNFQMAYHSTL
ncbi:cell death-inducing p53-target protein 1-like [Amphiura filiformis]|uniref:cell death-inducing p53-target protein 1-like n=1 Tax=Amphiura filiformis TaxID=82378 RepID=UPI003B213196